MKSLLGFAFVLLLFSCQSPPEPIALDDSLVEPHQRLKYYGVDKVAIDDMGMVKELLGPEINLVIQSVDCNDFDRLQALIDSAEEHQVQLILWPNGYGHQWTPWKWDGQNWDIQDGYAFLDYLTEYQKSGGTAVHSYLVSHEPFWNHGEPFSSDEIQDLSGKLRDYAPELKQFIHIGNLARQERDYVWVDPDNHIRIESGLADTVCIWWHGFGGQEGAPSTEDILEAIEEDIALAEERGIDMEIIFALQCFGWRDYGYDMPSAQEILDLAAQVSQVEGLDGILWYSWEPYGYSESLSMDPVDSRERSRYEAIRLIHQSAE